MAIRCCERVFSNHFFTFELEYNIFSVVDIFQLQKCNQRIHLKVFIRLRCDLKYKKNLFSAYSKFYN